MRYNFFYDETEHSRKINYNTVTAGNYEDSFITVIVGWLLEDEQDIADKYLAFESKYDYRKKGGELKSLTMKTRDFKYGFASLNKNTIGFYEDLISVFDEHIITYISVFSKIEYMINQLFVNYHSTMFVDINYMKYSIIKAINLYRPEKVIEAMYKDAYTFVKELKSFFEEKIRKNQANISLKEFENNAFKQILILLDDVELPERLEWNYFSSFEGFKKLLMEMHVNDYELLIDKEGDASQALLSARIVGLNNILEKDSKECMGIRVSDMLAGLIAKLMQALKTSLGRKHKDEKVEKELLESDWFAMNQRQLDLYKKLYRVICENNHYLYNTYTGIYADDFIAFVSLLQYMNHFENVEEIDNLEKQPEYYNTYVCDNLKQRFREMRCKVSFKTLQNDNKEYYYNQKSAKIYYDIEKQPTLGINEGENRYYVLSVGINKDGYPLVTISENGKPFCYRLPVEYKEWAINVIGLANSGYNYFPGEVIFYGRQ